MRGRGPGAQPHLYANAAAQLARTVYGVPHVVTTHSLEPLRPWKEEQLGGGYRLPQLLRAAFEMDPATQLVLCCGQPDTPRSRRRRPHWSTSCSGSE
ncbi:hypothetical protein [Streptomyces sp. NPDC001340]